MLLNLFFFTVTISKRQYSDKEIVKAYELSKQEARMDEMKSKSFEQVRFM